MIFEFDDFVLVVEVTLTTSSRQEEAEGEPVRRHVAEIVDKHAGTGKQVYGLFIAVTINSNTAETFRIGSWYRSDDSRLSLAIVPLTLTQFAAIFEAGFARGLLTPAKIKQIISDCRSTSSNEAPQWKVSIKAGVEEVVSGLMQ